MDSHIGDFFNLKPDIIRFLTLTLQKKLKREIWK